MNGLSKPTDNVGQHGKDNQEGKVSQLLLEIYAEGIFFREILRGDSY